MKFIIINYYVYSFINTDFEISKDRDVWLQ